MNKIFLLLIVFGNALTSLAQSDMIDNSTYNSAVNFYNTGITNYENSEFDAAIKDFRKAINLNYSNSDYHYGLASSFYELKAYDSAEVYIDIAIRLEPNQPDYHHRAGNIYFHLKNYKNAARNYGIALANLSDKYPINIQSCYYNKAVSEYNLKNYQAAVKDLNVLIEETPDDYAYLHLRGVSCLKMKQYRLACQDLIKANELGNESSKRYIDKYCK